MKKLINSIICKIFGHTFPNIYKIGKIVHMDCRRCEYGIIGELKGKFNIGFEPNYTSLLRKK